MTDFERVVTQLGSLVEEETLALRQVNHAGLAKFNSRKAHSLLEFTRAAGVLEKDARSLAQASTLLRDLRSKLDKNQRALKIHLDAVKEVSLILSNAISDCDSDGTYTQTSWRQGY